VARWSMVTSRSGGGEGRPPLALHFAKDRPWIHAWPEAPAGGFHPRPGEREGGEESAARVEHRDDRRRLTEASQISMELDVDNRQTVA